MSRSRAVQQIVTVRRERLRRVHRVDAVRLGLVSCGITFSIVLPVGLVSSAS